MSTPKLALKTLVISMAAAMAAPVLADTKQLPRIDVVGQGEDAVTKQPGSVAIVTKEDLQLQQPLSTEDALRRVPGINIKGEEETAVVANIGMRGLSSAEQKSLILEDGVPVAPGLFIGNGRYYNPRIQRMESIEVVKGAASLRYGPSTIGGVINYKTKTPDDGVSLSGRVGSHNMKEVTLEAGGSSPSGDAFAGIVATKAQSDGFMGKGYEMEDIMIKAGMAIGDNQMLGFKFSHTANDANISYRGLLLDDYKAGKTYNPAPDDWYLQERKAFDINHEIQLNDNAKLRTLVYWSDVSRDYWRYSAETEVVGQDSDGKDIKESVSSANAGRWLYTNSVTGNNRSFERIGLDTRLNLDYNAFGMQNESEFGLRVFTEESNDTRIRATRSQDRTGNNDRHRQDSANSYAVYGQNKFIINDKLAVTPGLRVESYQQKRVVLTDNNKTTSTSNTEVLPGVGATYQLNPMVQVYGGVYQAFSPAENGTSLTGDVDQKLEAERSTNIEVGVRGANNQMYYELTAFQMDFSNQVVDGNSDPALDKENAGKTLHQGLEAAFGIKLDGGFSIDTNLTYIPTSKFEAGDDKGNRISYSPEIMANLILGYKTGGLRTELAVHHTGEQYGSSDNQEEIGGSGTTGIEGIWGGKLDAYTTMDLNAYYTVNKQLSVFGAVKNLTDERYIAGLRQGIYAGPSRSFELGARYKF
ncbi:TonB-dependent receptor domain-containing protein [Thiomicrospira sp. ALE5]|uniref:TonB-dependent receptor family protein n=1 Tax=Thiomicrospira sp. ALE5 TaxID=748650 RepID=UPI0008DF5502|nr:TonB-dependent receptor [Thiomicrospira sp. ALE5]SFR56363.1 Fe(3+) dicitrate transport protein [Thiomicrospira sp. ALE5]